MPLNDFMIQPGETAKYLQLANWFESRIRSGEFPPGERLPSSRQLTRQLKLSSITTTAAMNELLRRKLVIRRHGSGTFVADGQEVERRFRIGFISPVADSAYVRKVLGYLWEVCGKCRCDLIPVCRSPEEIEETVIRYGLDGVFIYNRNNIPLKLVKRLHAGGTPALLLSSVMENASEFCVGYSNEQIIRDAVGYLAGLGHRRIGFICDGVTLLPNDARYKSFLAAMWELQLPVNPGWLLTSGTAAEQFHAYLAPDQRPSAVIVGIRILAAEFCAALNACGIRVPEELSVLCIDEPDEAEKLRPRLSLFRVDVERFTRQGVRYLLQLIRHEPPVPPQSRNYEFVDAGSCAPPSASP